MAMHKASKPSMGFRITVMLMLSGVLWGLIYVASQLVTR